MAKRRYDHKLVAMLREKGLTWREISLHLGGKHGPNPETVRNAHRQWRERLDAGQEDVPQPGDEPKKLQTADGATAVSYERPLSDEEMAEAFGIDMNHWVVRKRVTNIYAGQFQTKIWWEPNELNILADGWAGLLEELRALPPVKPVVYPHLGRQKQRLYEMCLYDAHIGSLAWGPETGEDYDLYIALDRYREAFRNLLYRCPVYAARILLVVGQDLFHFDTLIQGKGGATQKGTPQDVDTRWQKLFVAVAKMMEELIQEAHEIAPVDVIIQPGNHDTQTTFYLGSRLEARFWNTDTIRVDNTPKPRKYKRWGDHVLLGFTHGNREKAPMLYKLMNEEAGPMPRWCEWHRGHVHMEQCSEDGRMRIRTIPALAGRDAWHSEEGYNPMPGARAFVWDKALGLERVEYYNVPAEQARTDNLGEVLRD